MPTDQLLPRLQLLDGFPDALELGEQRPVPVHVEGPLPASVRVLLPGELLERCGVDGCCWWRSVWRVPVLLRRGTASAVGLLPSEDVDDVAGLLLCVGRVPLHHLHEDEALLEQVVRPFLARGLLDLVDARVWCFHSSSPPPHLTLSHALLRSGPLLTSPTCASTFSPISFLDLQQNSRTVYSAIPRVSPASCWVKAFFSAMATDAR